MSKYQLYQLYQLCPKCNGQGIVSKPDYVAGDVDTWVSGQTSYRCSMCNGTGKILEELLEEQGGKK